MSNFSLSPIEADDQPVPSLNQLYKATGQALRSVMKHLRKQMSALLGEAVHSIFNAVCAHARHLTDQLHRATKLLACEFAWNAVYADDQAALIWFTTCTLRLPRDSWPDVAEALAEDRWRRADDPLAYVAHIAWCKRTQHLRREAGSEQSISLDAPGAEAIAHAALIGSQNSAIADTELFIDLAAACQRANLPSEALLVIQARMAGWPRTEIGRYLGWSQQEVERVWKAITRGKAKLREALA